MPVQCYSVVEFEPQEDGRIHVTLSASQKQAPAHLEGLLKMVASSVRSEAQIQAPTSSWGVVHYKVDLGDMDKAVALIQAHAAPVVTTIDTGCDVSVCLDFTRVPTEGKHPSEWPRSDLGELANTKYQQFMPVASIQQLVQRMVSYIKTHPILELLDGISAVPGSGAGLANPLVRDIAKGVSSALQVPIVSLSRSVTTPPQKNVADEQSRANQEGTMAASLTGDHRRVVIIDDFMRHADTVREANRALRAARVEYVGAVTLVKDIRGTRGIQFPSNTTTGYGGEVP